MQPTVQMDSPPASGADHAPDGTSRAGTTELAKAPENPISDAHTMPLQNNTNPGVGSRSGTRGILNVQLVISIHPAEDRKVATRTVPPPVRRRPAQPGPGVPFGLPATTVSVSPATYQPIDGWMSDAAPIVQVPTIISETPGSDATEGGRALVVAKPAGPVVFGAYVNNVASLGGTSGHGATMYGLPAVNPFAQYTFGDGWFVSSAAIITAPELSANELSADELSAGARWTLPLGAQVGRVIRINGELPVDLLAGAYYNVLRPQFGGGWQFRTMAAFVF